MMTLNFYAIMQNDTKVLLQFLTSADDKDACKYFIDMILSSYKTVPDDEKVKYKGHVNGCSIVRVGSCNLIDHTFENNFNVLADLKDLKFESEVEKDESAS